MHRLRGLRARMSGRCDQAGHRAGPRKVAEHQHGIRQGMAQYYGQEGTSGRCQRVAGGGGQGTIFLAKSWRRHLSKAETRMRQQLAHLKRLSHLCQVARCYAVYGDGGAGKVAKTKKTAQELAAMV